MSDNVLGQRSYPTQSVIVKGAKNKSPKSFLLQKDLGDYCRDLTLFQGSNGELHSLAAALSRKQSVTDTQSFHNIKSNRPPERKINFMDGLGQLVYPTQSVNVKSHSLRRFQLKEKGLNSYCRPFSPFMGLVYLTLTTSYTKKTECKRNLLQNQVVGKHRLKMLYDHLGQRSYPTQSVIVKGGVR